MLEKLERKLGRFAIPGLMRYVVAMYVVGYIINLLNPAFYMQWLMFDVDMVFRHGQVWRLITFLVQPPENNIFFMALMVYVYYSIGTTLEKIWGTFRFNLFYFMGVLSNIIAVLIIYLITYLRFGYGQSFPISLEYLNMSMLLAFAVTFPEVRFLLMFIIPVKGKWLSIGYVIYFAYKILVSFIADPFYGLLTAIVIIVPMLNVLVYFLMVKRYLISPVQIKRRNDFKRSYREGAAAGYTTTNIRPEGSSKSSTVITRHKCAVCGRTELDGDNLQFRFCSKCNGNYEYCQDHLFTHEHIQ